MVSRALRAAQFVVIDVETTGVSAVSDRVTEIAAVVVEDGRVAEVFHSLVDPGVPVPPFITRLTGIDDRLVAGQPRFGDLLPQLQPLLDGRVFVAHNAGFDHAFLKQGFARLGQRFAPERLCTVRLARRLLPGLRSYRLDAVLAKLGIPQGTRHRARGDAEATAGVLLALLERAEQLGVSSLDDLLRLQGRPIPGRKRRGVDEAVVAALPDEPGVYLLKDEEGQVLYIGKSRHIRSRVRDHLRGECPGQPRLRKRLRQIVDVEAIETGSELEALFLESLLIKRYLPEANVMGRGWRGYPFLAIDLDEPFPRFEMTREPRAGVTLFGPLRRASSVAAAADLLQDTLGLRRCSDPIRAGMSACALLDLGKCLGPCVRPESHRAYGQAVAEALDFLEGRSTSVLERLTARRDQLAEELRFEQAAELRDRIRELERLLGDQQRLEAVARRNLVVVAPSRAAGCRELFVIRAGRLCEQRRVRLPVRADGLRRLLRTSFSGPAADGPIEREVVDEMHQLDAWLRRERASLATIAIEPDDPTAALPALLAAVRADRPCGKRGSRRESEAALQPELPTPVRSPR